MKQPSWRDSTKLELLQAMKEGMRERLRLLARVGRPSTSPERFSSEWGQLRQSDDHGPFGEPGSGKTG